MGLGYLQPGRGVFREKTPPGRPCAEGLDRRGAPRQCGPCCSGRRLRGQPGTQRRQGQGLQTTAGVVEQRPQITPVRAAGVLRPAALQREILVELGKYVSDCGHRATVAEPRPRCIRRAGPLPFCNPAVEGQSTRRSASGVRSASVGYPSIPMIRSASASIERSTCTMPSTPPNASPYAYGRPTPTAVAPSASA